MNMPPRKALEIAKDKLSAAAVQGHHRDVEFYSRVVYVLCQYGWQYQAAELDDAFYPDQVVKILNDYNRTCKEVHNMRDDIYHYGSIFRSRIIAGIGEQCENQDS